MIDFVCRKEIDLSALKSPLMSQEEDYLEAVLWGRNQG